MYKRQLEELGELVSVLRRDEEDTAPTKSLPTFDDLDTLIDTMRTSGLTVTWTRSGEPTRLSAPASLAAYRIVQEALTNAAKHGTGSADLNTAWTEDGLTIRIGNTAASEAGIGSGHGLVGMRERAEANGGTLSTERDGARFVVDAWLPSTTVREQST